MPVRAFSMEDDESSSELDSQQELDNLRMEVLDLIK
jgi:hypothetical protein